MDQTVVAVFVCSWILYMLCQVAFGINPRYETRVFSTIQKQLHLTKNKVVVIDTVFVALKCTCGFSIALELLPPHVPTPFWAGICTVFMAEIIVLKFVVIGTDRTASACYMISNFMVFFLGGRQRARSR